MSSASDAPSGDPGTSTTAGVVVMTTVDSDAAADELARGLVEARLAACVQVLPITSHYRWQGSLERVEERLLLVKTAADRAGEAQRWIAEHHPYEIPEILAVPVGARSAAYLAWLLQETRPSTLGS